MVGEKLRFRPDREPTQIGASSSTVLIKMICRPTEIEEI